MDRFFRWVQFRAPELAFFVAGMAAMDAGFDLMTNQAIAPILGTIMTVFGGLAAKQWDARKKAEKEADDEEFGIHDQP